MVYVPPALERYSHTEAGLTRIVSDNMEISAAAFRDRIETQALFVSSPDGRPGVVILDTSNLPSQGFRVHLNRHFRNFEAGIGYTSETGIGVDSDSAVENMRNRLTPRHFQMVAARFKAKLDMTQTEITTVYRWTSDFSALRLDPYQRLVEYNDPTLSLSIAQNLPTFRMFPGRVQAVVAARNLLHHPTRAQRAQFSQYPRLVKGGIKIRFCPWGWASRSVLLYTNSIIHIRLAADTAKLSLIFTIFWNTVC